MAQRTPHIPHRYLSAGHGAIKTCVKRQIRQRRVDLYHQERLSGHHLLSRNFYKWDLVRGGHLRVHEDFRMLTRHQLGVITALRTGHSRCNFAQHVLMHHQHYAEQWRRCHGDIGQLRLLHCQSECCANNNSGLCPHCSVPETEQHFLLDCPGHAALRRRTFGGFFAVYPQIGADFNLKTLLFPPKSLGWRHRKELMQNIVLFAVQTGRFDRYH